MATEKIRVGIIGASMRNGWGRDAHIPALRALPELEITAVSTSRQETADETVFPAVAHWFRMYGRQLFPNNRDGTVVRNPDLNSNLRWGRIVGEGRSQLGLRTHDP